MGVKVGCGKCTCKEGRVKICVCNVTGFPLVLL